jgi:hypothetical protein
MIRRLLIALALVSSAALIFLVVAPTANNRSDDSFNTVTGDTALDNARAEYHALGDSAIRLDRALERAIAIDAARTVRSASAPAFSAHAGVTANVRAAFAAVADSQLASLGVSKVPVRVVLVSAEELTTGYRRVAVLPSTADAPCVSVIQIAASGRGASPVAHDRLVGVCGFYARHGLPGRGVLSWIDSSFAQSMSLDAVPPRPPRDLRSRESFGGYSMALAPATAACVAGRDEPCGRALAGYDWVYEPRLRYRATPGENGVRTLRTSSQTVRWAQSAYFARMRERVGEEAFTRIWTSDAPPPQAYEQVVGESFAEFVRPLLLEGVTPHKPGPLQAELPLALSLSLGALSAAWAIRRTRRERS